MEQVRCAPLRRGGDSSEVPNSCEPKRGVWPALHLEMGIGEEWAKAKLVLQLRCDNCLMIIDNKIAVLRWFFFCRTLNVLLLLSFSLSLSKPLLCSVAFLL